MQDAVCIEKEHSRCAFVRGRGEGCTAPLGVHWDHHGMALFFSFIRLFSYFLMLVLFRIYDFSLLRRLHYPTARAVAARSLTTAGDCPTVSGRWTGNILSLGRWLQFDNGKHYSWIEESTMQGQGLSAKYCMD